MVITLAITQQIRYGFRGMHWVIAALKAFNVLRLFSNRRILNFPNCITRQDMMQFTRVEIKNGQTDQPRFKSPHRKGNFLPIWGAIPFPSNTGAS